jgi:hypothetical protein
MSEQNNKPFPTLEEFREWSQQNHAFLTNDLIYNYFKDRVRTVMVMPEVGKEYEFHDGITWVRYKLNSFNAGHGGYYHIRPIQPPSRESIIEKARQVLGEDEINILTGGNR